MKKEYTKPCVEIEVYQLDAAIATTCGNKINLGPEHPGYETCDEYKDGFGGSTEWTLRSGGNTPFYQNGDAHCDCYYTSGAKGYFTS